ncbi:DEAD/DEAH box helicase family protein [Fictibacillus sp. UD]|uniref:DEAD/DEAH box helicase n=1 Tax=Fictibacillus sp. UD TaxID=3038777 RepID=UPI0037473C9E
MKNDAQLDKDLLTALRPYQIEALCMIRQYISSDSMKQALVKMPMGTGKSTVIAVTGSELTPSQSVIVVTSTKAVRDQLIKDISEEVWLKMGLTKRPPKTVYMLKPSTLTNIPDSPTIFVSTIQALLTLKENYVDQFKNLQNKVDLVLFDEGHKEPASTWQSVIRSFGKKIVLFTATPVRNDSNKFQLDINFTYTYSYEKAKKHGYIRDITFEYMHIDNEIKTFAERIYNRFKDYVVKESCDEGEIKCIIRCGNADEIRAMVEELKDKISVIGIHERFKNDSNDLLTDHVPENLRTSDISIWIHQNKLIEGIDNQQFSILGIYEPLPDPRSLIQQIGRVIRKGSESRKAIILLRENESYQKEWWDSYIEYERLISLNPEEIVFKYNDYFMKVREANPSTTYLNKKFLKRFSVNSDQTVEERIKKYQLPMKANVFEAIDHIGDVQSYIESFSEKIIDDFNSLDFLILDKINILDKRTACIIYSRYENSSILVNDSFLEIKLEIAVFRFLQNKLYYHASNQYIPSFIYDEWKKINAAQLKKILPNDSHISSVTIQNGSINYNSFNRMVVDSQDVSTMIPDVNDKFNLCTTLVGSRKKKLGTPSIRNYIGFSNARISQGTEYITLPSYLDWLEEIDMKITNSSYQEHGIFHRFATVTDIPAKVAPKSILFQFNEEDVTLKTDYGTLTELDQLFYTIKDSKFNLKWDDNSYEIDIKFSFKEGKYVLNLTTPTNEPNVYVSIKNKSKIRLLNWLNEEQAFQIIVEGNTHRYFMGNFHNIGIPSDYNWLENIFDEYTLSLPARTKKINEKGNKAKGSIYKSIWDPNSLFYLVAKKGDNITNISTIKTLLQDADYVICTDLQTEIADFITISETTQTVCFIHCKAGKSKLSASAFQEVCGQIVKNLDYVNKGSNRRPNYTYWEKEWVNSYYKVKANRNIFNPNNLTAEGIWRKLKEVQNNPNSKTKVIALVGDAFSKSRYLAEKNKKFEKQKPEVIQIDYLLNQTAVAIGRAQAEFLLSFNKL